MSKRERSANYSKDEEKLLLQCVLRKAHIVECRKTDATTSSTKNRAWAKITSDYNCQAPGNIRNEKQLRSKYKAVKKSLRQTAAAERRGRLATGGGKAPQEWLAESEELQQVAAIISVSINGLTPFFDDDQKCTDTETTLLSNVDADQEIPHTSSNVVAARETSHTPVSTCTQLSGNPIDDDQQFTDVQIALLSNCDSVCEESPASVSGHPISKQTASASRQLNVSPLPLKDWSEYTPLMLRKQTHPLLKRANNKRSDTDDLAAKKKHVLESEMALIELRKQHAIEDHNLRLKEHNLRFQQSSEEHKLRMKEHNLRMQHMQERHEMRMKNEKRTIRFRSVSRSPNESASNSSRASQESNYSRLPHYE